MRNITIGLLACIISIHSALAQPEITVMDPISEKGEHIVTAEEVRATIESRNNDNVLEDKSEEASFEPTALEEHDFDESQMRDIRCLTEAIYFESLHEPRSGQIAVANVIMNRANWNGDNPNNRHRIEFSGSICDVVDFKITKVRFKTRGIGRHAVRHRKMFTTCAFSYRCERGFHSKLGRAEERPIWNEINSLAVQTYLNYNSGNNVDPSGGATFYHANYVRPWWRKIYSKTTQIGAHIFYKIPENHYRLQQQQSTNNLTREVFTSSAINYETNSWGLY